MRPSNLLRGRAWSVTIRGTRYAIGTPRSSLPTGAKRVKGPNGGIELATKPFGGAGDQPAEAVVSALRRPLL